MLTVHKGYAFEFVIYFDSKLMCDVKLLNRKYKDQQTRTRVFTNDAYKSIYIFFWDIHSYVLLYFENMKSWVAIFNF